MRVLLALLFACTVILAMPAGGTARTVPDGFPHVTTLAEAREIWHCDPTQHRICVVYDNPGGNELQFLEAMMILRAHQIPLVVAGSCRSACAKYFAMAAAHGKGCVRQNPQATLGLHQARDIVTGEARDTSYGPRLDAHVRANWWLGMPPPEDIGIVSNEEARSMFPTCDTRVRHVRRHL
ncbi:hypothetical protein FJY94_03975 [Candidatus Kaiserbacteria bacterium]|nr:hypothetical protein [Candidatus Kaiserbacteria bacterium]